MPAVYLTKTDERKARTERILKIAFMEQGTTQKALAKELGMKYGTLNHRVKNPETMTIGEAWKILDALEVRDRGRILE